ncbi:hypothetical protein CH256_19730 [Rhodococcus sp. 05-2254-6]|nr:hypothetical protein CH256_19730 [Rhodococcus sp. 05-2254-6]OZE42179.1 hypothetical protein CH259_02010 [Rhodococcus sp. 05-2254-4]OZE49891.1 hypothetical protein CH261_05310 [Rhodococcus sp. 05-2254-3]OZE50529.1 hypothetical protein CH283_12615 [Rhodococcus sp. 05-2254-2]
MIGSMKVLSMLLAGLSVGYSISVMALREPLLYNDFGIGASAIVDGVVVLAIAAAATAVVLARSGGRAAPWIAVAALLVIVFESLGMAPGLLGDWAAALSAGVLLGTSAILAASHRGAQAALAVGLLAAARVGAELGTLLTSSSGRQFAWEVAGPEDAVVPQRAAIAVVLAVLAAVFLVAGYRTSSVATSQASTRTLAVGIALPLVAGGFGWWATEYRDSTLVWFLALAGLTVAALVAAWLLPKRDGSLILVLFASWAAGVSSFDFADRSYASVGLTVFLLAVGGLIACRFPQIYLGLFALLMVAAVDFAQNMGVGLPLSIQQWVVPFIAAYVLVSALPTAPTSLAVGMTVPFTMALTVTIYGGSYGPLDSADDFEFFGSSQPSATALSIGGLVVLSVCAAGVWLLRRR